MKNVLFKLKKFTSLMAAMLFMYVVVRAIFIYTVSRTAGEYIPFSKYLIYIWNGLRFDIAGLSILNSLFIVLYFFPYGFTDSKWMKKATLYLFIITNALGLLVSVSDIVYFPYVQKRIQYDTFLYLTGEKGDNVYTILYLFIKGNWPLIVLFLLMLYAVIKYSKRILGKAIQQHRKFNDYLISTVSYLLLIGLCILGIRGGFQIKPLNIIHASEMVSAKEAPYILNTPFTIIKSMERVSLPPVEYFPMEGYSFCELPLSVPKIKDKFEAKNVVIIIVESLSQSYMSYYNGTSETPFLDSLFRKSLVFNNAYANAKESIQGIPAVVASIPSWQDDSYIFSQYANNQVQSIASLLKPYGYRSYFFHGAGKGSMGFDSFASSVGFDTYVGKEDYPNMDEFDGAWGIWDEPFLQHMNTLISKEKKPFVSVLFTINSHHPYRTPAKYGNRFKIKGHPINTVVKYTDFALQQFFEKAKNEAWFNNTLFVITADHTGPNTGDNLTNKKDVSIPIVFYQPNGGLVGERHDVANQIDIMPSILDILHYNKPYYSLGKSLFNNDCNRYSINYKAGLYHCYSKEYCYQFNGENCVGFYNVSKDPLFKNNLQNDNTYSNAIIEHETFIKKQIQAFNQSMIRNTMTFDRFVNVYKIFQTK
jgi:hypothetical protein